MAKVGEGIVNATGSLQNHARKIRKTCGWKYT